MYDSNLKEADVIFDMMPEAEDDMEKLYSKKIRNGTRLIKHDLPLIGYLPDKIDYPFYRMTFPLQKAKSRNQWASKVLQKNNVKISNLWHELYYYEYEKGWSKWDTKRYEKLLSARLRR